MGECLIRKQSTK